MNERVHYVVSWSPDGHPTERRTFEEWEPAKEFYDGLVEDRRTEKASLFEVTEKEVRCFEHEAKRAAESVSAA